MPVTLVKSGWSSGCLVFEQESSSGAIHFGVDDTGLDVKFFGATSGKYALWDESADKWILAADMSCSGTATFTGAVDLSGATVTGMTLTASVVAPDADDGAALGSTSLKWSDLFLASGAVINFNNGDVTITHAANTLAIAGGTSYTVDAAITPATNDAAALGSGTLSFADLFLATGGVINWLNGSTTITHSAGVLTLGGSASAQTLALGVAGTGWSLIAYGDTTGCSLTWDQANDQLQIVQTNAATTGTERAATVAQTHTGIGASAEVLSVTLTTETVGGVYQNAIYGKIDYVTTGALTGLAGVVCAELSMPAGPIAGSVGTYAAFEAEIDCPLNYTGDVPIHVFSINVWGDAKTQFDTYGYLFDLTGVSSGAGSIWYDNQKAAPAVEEFIRVKTPAGVRYLGLYNANA